MPHPEGRFWTSRSLDRVVYVPHEHSISFGGAWLIEEIKAIGPPWRARRYTGWDYASHLHQTVWQDNPWFAAAWWDLP